HRDLLSFPTRRSSDLSRENLNFFNLFTSISHHMILAIRFIVSSKVLYSSTVCCKNSFILSIFLIASSISGLVPDLYAPIFIKSRSEEHTSELQSRENL